MPTVEYRIKSWYSAEREIIVVLIRADFENVSAFPGRFRASHLTGDGQHNTRRRFPIDQSAGLPACAGDPVAVDVFSPWLRRAASIFDVANSPTTIAITTKTALK